MNELDKKILDLFRYLISTGTKYLSDIDYSCHKFVYLVGDKEISLNICSFDKDYEQKPNSYSTLKDVLHRGWSLGALHSLAICNVEEEIVGYKLSIKGKTYIVPKLRRVEHAQVLDRIEAIIEEKESETLDSVINKLTEDSREEL